MKQLVCEMCGSTDLVKDGGVFVCRSCGCKYSVEEARKMMVEGVVEVTGSVAIDNTANVDTWLDLAVKAVDAHNGAQANDYADRVLQVDPRHARAWFIKGKAALLESTVGIDRQSEALKYFKESTAIVHGRLDSASADDIMLLREIQKASTEMALTRALVFAKNYSELQSQPSLQRLLSMKSICNDVALSNAAVAAPLRSKKKECIAALAGAGMSNAAAEKTYKEIMDHEVESGQMYSGVAFTMNNTANEVGRASIKHWEESGHIFDFYGLENSTLEMGERREKKAWGDYVDGLDDDMSVILAAIAIYEKPETATFFASEAKLDSAIKDCYDNLIFLQQHARDARTNRRYHNRLSNGNVVTNDGYGLLESAKQQRNVKLAEWETARDEHDPWKRQQKAQKLAEEEAERKRKRAEDALHRRYFIAHPEEKSSLESTEAHIEEAKKQRADCLEQMKQVGSFDRKKGNSLMATVDELKVSIERLESEKESIIDRRNTWAASQVDALLAIDESEWSKDETWETVERESAQKIAEDAAEADRKRAEAARMAEEAEAKKKKARRTAAIVGIAAAIVITCFMVYTNVLVPKSKYEAALAKADEGNYDEAIAELKALGSYGDASHQVTLVEKAKQSAIIADKKKEAEKAVADGDYDTAVKLYAEIEDVDTANNVREKWAKELYKSGDYYEAMDKYRQAGDDAKVLACINKMIETGDYKRAIQNLPDLINKNIEGASDSLNAAKYQYVKDNYNNEDENTYEYLVSLREANYKDSSSLFDSLYELRVTSSSFENKPVHLYNNIHYRFEVSGCMPGKHETRTLSIYDSCHNETKTQKLYGYNTYGITISQKISGGAHSATITITDDSTGKLLWNETISF